MGLKQAVEPVCLFVGEPLFGHCQDNVMIRSQQGIAIPYMPPFLLPPPFPSFPQPQPYPLSSLYTLETVTAC